jgi:hypothetical protein
MANVNLDNTYLTTVSQIAKKALHTPFSGSGLPVVLGLIGKLFNAQFVAATATQKQVARHSGKLRKILIGTANLAAGGESMVFDVQVNGVTVFTGTPTLVNVSSAVGLYDVSALIVAGTVINAGDVISVVRTLAGGSTLTGTDVSMEWG